MTYLVQQTQKTGFCLVSRKTPWLLIQIWCDDLFQSVITGVTLCLVLKFGAMTWNGKSVHGGRWTCNKWWWQWSVARWHCWHNANCWSWYRYTHVFCSHLMTLHWTWLRLGSFYTWFDTWDYFRHGQWLTVFAIVVTHM